jgi:hypothetical protein
LAIPTVRDWGSEFITEAKLDEISAALNYLLAPPRCFAYRSTTMTLSQATWEVVNLNAEQYDSGAMHDNATNNTRVTATETGIYVAKCSVRFETGTASTYRGVQVRKNAAGSDLSGTRIAIKLEPALGGGEPSIFGFSVDVPMTAGDYLELFARQATGSGTLDIGGGAEYTYLSVRWITKTV